MACDSALQLERVDFSPAPFAIWGAALKPEYKMEEVTKVSGPSFQELLAAELRLDPRQWEEAPRRHEDRPVSNFSTPAASAVTQRREALLEIDCLVSYCCVYTTFNMITTALYAKLTYCTLYSQIHAYMYIHFQHLNYP